MERKIIFALVVALLVSVSVNFCAYKRMAELDSFVRTDTVEVVEFVEVKDTLPSEKTSIVVRTVKVAVEKDSLSMYDDSDCSECCDSIELDITQKVYEDSTYTAYVSGYLPALDSIFVRQKIIRETILKENVIREKEYRRWNVGLVGGYGYGFESKRIEPFIGIGVTFNLF